MEYNPRQEQHNKTRDKAMEIILQYSKLTVESKPDECQTTNFIFLTLIRICKLRMVYYRNDAVLWFAWLVCRRSGDSSMQFQNENILLCLYLEIHINS